MTMLMMTVVCLPVVLAAEAQVGVEVVVRAGKIVPDSFSFSCSGEGRGRSKGGRANGGKCGDKGERWGITMTRLMLL